MGIRETDIAVLILKRLRRQLNEEERVQLEEWRNLSEVNRQKYQELTDFYAIQLKLKNYGEAEEWAGQFRLPELLGKAPASKPGRSNSMFSRTGWLAAASIIALLGLGIYFYTVNNRQQQPTAKNISGDIPAPATNRAMITLADGSKVYLDGIGSGQLAQQGNIRLVKLGNGEIAYQTATGKVLKEPQSNTLTNPRGSKVIDMQLSDGSHVWLNAGSAITYPVAFTGNERKVELKGEGYFEVAKDKTKKFIVSSKGVTTEVLGTHFNVNAYSNEPETKVTLLEGSVRAGNNNNTVVIKPGQQAVANNGSVKVNASPNLDQVMAWKNGYFSFDGLTLKQAMTQLERWYDIDVVYEEGVADEGLMGKMTRGITLNELMDVLQKLGVHYQLEGRKLIIKK
ncbi:MAG: FecR domain-containing protein [Niabella sp.]|nr:FecR domain-containing protein [Niabella sp.]